MTRRLLDAKGAAELLNVPVSWVLAQARADRIPHIRLGRYVRFDADELLEWCGGQQRGPRTVRTDYDHLQQRKWRRAGGAADAVARGA